MLSTSPGWAEPQEALSRTVILTRRIHKLNRVNQYRQAAGYVDRILKMYGAAAGSLYPSLH
jgi:hypothetical protein